ncbi:MAG: hypothetical protein DME26_20075 [Verrucomicrobia bacterium]|nr:MAG: hypothetical protein DME26_20075 [Verrucomicrobiota bacterium]
MPDFPQPLDLRRLKVHPLAERLSQSRLEEILVEPDDPPPRCAENIARTIRACAQKIIAARRRNAAVMLIYGAHLIKNGGQLLINRLMESGWLTHLATNGAGIIHDWEFAFLGRSTENVRDNVASGTFGAWDETGRNIHLALLAGGLRADGFGRALGRLMVQPVAPALADLLQAMRSHQLKPGRHTVPHPWRHTSVLAQAFRQEIPLTVHPGIGYDIISNHPMFNGAVIGRAAEIDFRLFGASVEKLDGGVVLSIGSAIMGPQVFEKSLSCVNNLRLQGRRPIVKDHTIYVVDLQDGGSWDWTKGEPPKDNPAYYLRFCKSYSRMGGTMHYVQRDNLAFLHNLFHALPREHPKT